MFTDIQLGEAWGHLESGGADVLVVDVFDSLLWRLVPQRAHLFLLLGERLAAAGRLPVDLTAGQFAHLRLLAERTARRGARLDEIWSLLRPALLGPERGGRDHGGRDRDGGHDAGELETFAEAELAVLRAAHRVDLAAVELVELAALKLGLPVYLVADTCLSAGQLERLLARPELAGIPIAGFATAADVGAGAGAGARTTGPLLRHVRASVGAPAARILHLTGDPAGMGAEPAADRPDGEPAGGAGEPAVLTVRRGGRAAAGLRARLATEGLLGDPDDATPLDPEYGDFGLTALRARVLQYSEAAAVPAALRRFWDTGATVFGPVLTGFAEWVVERTEELGAHEVFCLMRSGELLADLLAGPGRDAGVSAYPLWASRDICALANVFEASPAELRAFLTEVGAGPAAGGAAVATVGALLRRLGVDLAAAPGISALAGRRLDVSNGLLDELLDELLATLSQDDRIRGEIVLAAARLRDRFLRYLDERLPEQGTAVLVDLGWDGATQVLLARLLAATGRDVVPVGLYLATGPRAHGHRLAGHRMDGYLAAAGQPARLAGPLLRAPAIVEQVTMADAGRLTSFDEAANPLLGLTRASRTQLAQRVAAQDGIRAFQREWLRYRRAEGPASPDSVLPSLGGAGARRALLRTLTRFVARPTTAEASAFGAWQPDGADEAPLAGLPGGEASWPRYARPLAARAELVRRMPYLSPAGLAELSPGEAVWPAAVAAMSNRPLALATELAQAAGVDPRELSVAAAAGPVEVYVDTGSDFVHGPKATVTPYAGRDGLSLVRLRVDAVGARRLRIDPAGRRGLLRLDWLTLAFHVVGAGGPRRITMTAFDGAASWEPEGTNSDRVTDLGDRRWGVVLGLVGLRLLQPNLAEILDDDPQLVYNLDLPAMPELGGTYAIDIEFAFGWMGIRGDPVAAHGPAAASPAAGPQLPRRAARRVMRQLGGLR